MTRKEQGQNEASHDDSVPSEGLKAILLHEADKELDGQQGNDECHHVADDERVEIVENQF